MLTLFKGFPENMKSQILAYCSPRKDEEDVSPSNHSGIKFSLLTESNELLVSDDLLSFHPTSLNNMNSLNPDDIP